MLTSQLVNGLSVGAVYAIIAAGVGLIYYVLRVIWFAHGEMVVIGAYIGLFSLRATGDPWLAILVALAVGVVFGMTVERLLLRPLRGQDPLAAVLLSFGVILVLRESIRLSYRSGQAQLYPQALGSDAFSIGATSVRWSQLVAILAALLLVAVLEFLLQRTRVGVGMRAMAENLDVSRGMGIRVDRLASVTVAFASATGAGAGVLVGLLFGQTSPYIGIAFGLKAVAVVLFAGSGRIVAAMVGGVMIGLTEAFSVAYLSSSYRELFVWTLIVGVLFVRPRGLFPRVQIVRV